MHFDKYFDIKFPILISEKVLSESSYKKNLQDGNFEPRQNHSDKFLSDDAGLQLISLSISLNDVSIGH